MKNIFKSLNIINNRYYSKISAYPFWENDLNTVLPQYKIYNHIKSFLDSNSNKKRKVLFLGYDGMRADALPNLMNKKESGVKTLANEGGLYLAYCGGEKENKTLQTTSTSSGWTSEFTGVWGNRHGVKTNDDEKNPDWKTVMLEYALNGYSSSIVFSWGHYFDMNLRDEVSFVMNHPEVKFTICELGRSRKNELPKSSCAKNIEMYNFVADEFFAGEAPTDDKLRDYVLKRISLNDDIVVGIFDGIDGNGHAKKFSNKNPDYVKACEDCDFYAYEVINAVKEREKTLGEEWLIVFASDHGGIYRRHGAQTAPEKTTWIATNRKLK